jgi:hypothetical protein
MATLAFAKNNLVYNTPKKLSEAVTKFKTSLAFSLESGIWENNVSRYKAEMLALQNVIGKVAIDAAIANGTLKEIKAKTKTDATGAKPAKPFDAAKIADSLGSKYTTPQIKAIITALQKLIV